MITLLTQKRLHQLREYLRIASKVLNKNVLIDKPLAYASPDIGVHIENYSSRIECASSLVRFCILRYKIELPRIKLNFFDMKDAGSITVKNKIWYIRLNRKYENSLVALTAIVSHEIAHIILIDNKVELSPIIQNEELTDAITILGGFGLAQSYIKNFQLDNFTHKIGYLSHEDVAFFNRIKHLISSDRPTKKFVPIDISRVKKISCYCCKQVIKLPDKFGTFIITCPICQYKKILSFTYGTGVISNNIFIKIKNNFVLWLQSSIDYANELINEI